MPLLKRAFGGYVDNVTQNLCLVVDEIRRNSVSRRSGNRMLIVSKIEIELLIIDGIAALL